MGCSSINLQLKAMIVLASLILYLPSGNARTFYVSTTGNDSNTGSISSPWRTILYAWRHSGGGDTVLVQKGVYLEILDNRFSGSQKKPPLYFIGNKSLIQGNTVDITGSESHGIYIMHGSNNIIRNNFITGMAKYGLHIYDEDKYPNEPPPVIKNLIIENNVITNSSSNSGIIISSGADPPGGILNNNVVVRNNIIINNKSYGIYISHGGTNENIEIYNNTLYNNNGGIYINGSIADSIAVYNNVFVSNDSGNINAIDVTTLKVSHNLYWKPALIGNGAADDYAVCQDPLFLNINEGDFRLQVDSPAIDAGVDIGLPFMGKAPDLGAYEDGSSTIGKLKSKMMNSFNK